MKKVMITGMEDFIGGSLAFQLEKMVFSYYGLKTYFLNLNWGEDLLSFLKCRIDDCFSMLERVQIL
jgi:hypothetical protein